MIALLAFFVIYLFTVLWFTVFNRSLRFQAAQFELFWSYRAWFAGGTDLGKEIIANIVMFIPFGFLMSSALLTELSTAFSKSARKMWIICIITILAAALFSLTIETLQLFLMRGLFEWDDGISNTIGAVIGVALYMLVRKLASEKQRMTATSSIGLIFVLVCLGVYISGRGATGLEADTTSRAYCFQIDEADLDGKTLRISGFTFRYGHTDEELSLILRSTKTGEKIKLATQYGIMRPDVDGYFLCEYDYSHTGFTATGTVDPEDEYEIMIRWPWIISTSSGVFITGDNVHYTPEEAFTSPVTAGSDLYKIVNNGVLRVYRPDYHCWVYQVNNSLYWIVDQDFNFEDDGTTYIQYQMWTTQADKLPEKRIENGWMWDNIGGDFEDYEIYGDYGSYRIMKREIPTAYSVTSIVTGYYKKGEWIWKNYFRPIYEFGGADK